jgi:hypothetical protein
MEKEELKNGVYLIKADSKDYSLTKEKEEKINSLEINEKVDRAYTFVTSLDWDVIAKEFIKAIRQLTK